MISQAGNAVPFRTTTHRREENVMNVRHLRGTGWVNGNNRGHRGCRGRFFIFSKIPTATHGED